MRKLLPLLFSVLLLQACAASKALPPATDLKASDAEVVVIGKIELVPPLDGTEQKKRWNHFGTEHFFRIRMATGAESRPVTVGQVKSSEYRTHLEVDWGKPFIVKAPRQRTYLNGGFTWLDIEDSTKLWFPGGYYFDVPGGAKAVYIGTLRFHRNDFNTITKVEVVDERRDVATALKTAGSQAEVTPSLLKRVR